MMLSIYLTLLHVYLDLAIALVVTLAMEDFEDVLAIKYKNNIKIKLQLLLYVLLHTRIALVRLVVLEDFEMVLCIYKTLQQV